MDSILLTYGLPIAALIFGAVAFLIARRSAHEFDRKYGRGHDGHHHPAE